jgi:hypothetical protein
LNIREKENSKMEAMDAKIQAAREHYLNSQYGRFDLIESVISKEIIMMKPRLLLKQLCILLEIEPNQVSYDALVKWQARFRASHFKRLQSLEKAENIKRVQNKQDAYDFAPTDPLTRPMAEVGVINIL